MPLRAPPELTVVPPPDDSEWFTVDSNAPLRLADLAIEKRWIDSQSRITHRRWNEKSYEWSLETGAYSELPKDKVNQVLYRLLDKTKYPTAGNDGPSMKWVKPNTKTVTETRNALVDRTLVSGSQPQWLVNCQVAGKVTQCKIPFNRPFTIAANSR